MTIYIGTSGFSYDDWVGKFYPETLQRNEWLGYYSTYFNTIELNVTFYRMPQKNIFSSWYKKTGKGFLFSVKGSRYITHIKRLHDTKDAIDYFFSGVNLLKEKLGVILWQFPPSLSPDIKVFSNFLKHISKYNKSVHAFEFRSALWLRDDIINLIKDAGATVCISDWNGVEMPYIPGFNFYYIRRHGPKKAPLYSGSYTKREIIADARMIQSKMKGMDVFVYYNNDVRAHAIANAFELKKKLAKNSK
jgi:uncharacterized protein YecE (DUF72 family)